MKNAIQPEGNYYDKYSSKNPIVKWMMSGYFRALNQMLYLTELLGGGEVHLLEAGCGEGEVSMYISKNNPDIVIDAFDISDEVIRNIQCEESNIRFVVGNIYNMSVHVPNKEKVIVLKDKYDIVVCVEVLEHLNDYDLAIESLKTKSSRYILVSVPNEPIWRALNVCRGKYLRDWGNTPGHVNHWSKKGFIKLLDNHGVNVVSVKTPFPWTMVLCEIEQ